MQISISNIVKGTVIGSAFTAISRYFTRVTQAGAIYEKPLCVESGINSSPLLQQASMLILPSGYKGGKLYAEIPTNGNGDLTWTRASDAWRTNADGLIQRVPWNLLQNSETFSNAIWVKNASTITADSTTAPNGTLTADTLTADGTLNFHQASQSISVTSGTIYTWSIYAKKNTNNFVQLTPAGAIFGTNVWANFDLNNGVVGSFGSLTTASIENVGNGWYRCSVTGAATATTSGTFASIIVTSSTASRGENNTLLTSIFIWGAQLVEGTTAQTYLPTTDRLNFPRLSYMYGSCPSALLEPQRTNLVLQSNTFNTTWALFGGATITSNSTTSPEGLTNATTLNSAGGSNDFLYQSFIVNNATTYTVSFFVKNVNSTQSKFYIPIAAFPEAFINWSGSTITSVTSSGTNSFTAMSNGWYRVAVTATATATGTYIFRIYSDNNNTSKSVYIYGAQLEAGAYPTTYIPTTGSATATRVADSFSRSNIYTNGLISASGGTWFVELRGNVAYTRDASTRIGIGDDSTLLTNSLFLNPVFGGGRIYIQKCVSGSIIGLYQTTTNTCKIAIKWNGTSADIFENGVKVVSATSFTATNMEWLTGNAGTPVFIQQMALHPEPLTDAKLIELTTL